ncbi:MAG: putative addiction module antidote protein [Bacteriovoracaceae bacterium]|nr:putative addiction module antidote protein [Bacteriovoracaceae bacterium]
MLHKHLDDAETAAEYLNEHMGYEGIKRKELLLQAFKNVLEAQGFTNLAKKSGISRRSLHHAFSEKGNPTLDTLFALLDTIGLELHFSTSTKKRKSKKSAVA